MKCPVKCPTLAERNCKRRSARTDANSNVLIYKNNRQFSLVVSLSISVSEARRAVKWETLARGLATVFSRSDWPNNGPVVVAIMPIMRSATENCHRYRWWMTTMILDATRGSCRGWEALSGSHDPDGTLSCPRVHGPVCLPDNTECPSFLGDWW